jgi:hypothetical protein
MSSRLISRFKRSSLKSRGTGHLVPDLVECSVLVENNKSKLTTRNLKRPPQNYLSSSSNKTVKCSLCQNQGEEMTPFSRNSKETIIFYKQILQQEQMPAMPASRYLTWFCVGCAGTLGKLVKLKEKIETITTVLRNVVRIQQKGSIYLKILNIMIINYGFQVKMDNSVFDKEATSLILMTKTAMIIILYKMKKNIKFVLITLMKKCKNLKNKMVHS